MDVSQYLLDNAVLIFEMAILGVLSYLARTMRQSERRQATLETRTNSIEQAQGELKTTIAETAANAKNDHDNQNAKIEQSIREGDESRRRLYSEIKETKETLTTNLRETDRTLATVKEQVSFIYGTMNGGPKRKPKEG